LVVDDNQDSANSLGLLAQIMGHEVRTAYDGPSALALATAFVPEVVLLDVDMPGMDGYEIAQRLRQLPALASTVLVAQTGWGQEEDFRRAKEAGFDHHLIKPLEMKDLQKVLA
jgi:CheY-like chemotaxis protein